MARLKLEVEVDSVYHAALIVASIGRSPEARKSIVEKTIDGTFDSLFTGMVLVRAEMED